MLIESLFLEFVDFFVGYPDALFPYIKLRDSFAMKGQAKLVEFGVSRKRILEDSLKEEGLDRFFTKVNRVVLVDGVGEGSENRLVIAVGVRAGSYDNDDDHGEEPNEAGEGS